MSVSGSADSGDIIGYLVLLGSTSSHGGTVISACSKTKANSKLIARIGDLHSCPIYGHGTTPITTGSSTINVEGAGVAILDYSVTGCGAIIDGNGAS